VISKLLGIPPMILPMFRSVLANVYSLPYIARSSFIPLTYALLRFA
jgi:hypothetical protein